jgi:transcriptional regulator with XRE-family HTH domain
MRTRDNGGMTQPEFAQLIGKSQSWVSRLEDPNQAPPTIPSLLKVAEAFDVDLEIHFSGFSALLERLDAVTPESLVAPSFREELENGAFERKHPGKAVVASGAEPPRSSFREGDYRTERGQRTSVSWAIPESFALNGNNSPCCTGQATAYWNANSAGFGTQRLPQGAEGATSVMESAG